jgi:hypothetical protein
MSRRVPENNDQNKQWSVTDNCRNTENDTVWYGFTDLHCCINLADTRSTLLKSFMCTLKTRSHTVVRTYRTTKLGLSGVIHKIEFAVEPSWRSVNVSPRHYDLLLSRKTYYKFYTHRLCIYFTRNLWYKYHYSSVWHSESTIDGQ